MKRKVSWQGWFCKMLRAEGLGDWRGDGGKDCAQVALDQESSKGENVSGDQASQGGVARALGEALQLLRGLQLRVHRVGALQKEKSDGGVKLSKSPSRDILFTRFSWAASIYMTTRSYTGI